MGRRRDNNAFVVLYEIGVMLPWWVTVLLALAAYVFLHGYAESDPVIAADPRKALDTGEPAPARADS